MRADRMRDLLDADCAHVFAVARPLHKHLSAYVSIRQHTSAYVSIRQHTSACVSIRQHTSAYVSIRQETSGYVSTHLCVEVIVISGNKDVDVSHNF
jgi:hypothetical protein